MDHTPLAQRDELASEHQLGLLEMRRTPMTFKGWTLVFGGILAGWFLIFMVAIYSTGASLASAIESSPQPAIVVAILPFFFFGLLVIPAIIESFTCYAVYIYTNGLVYLNRSRSGVAHWEEIEKVELQRGEYAALDVYLKDGTRIRFISTYPSRGSARLSTLHTFIRERVPPAHLRASKR